MILRLPGANADPPERARPWNVLAVCGAAVSAEWCSLKESGERDKQRRTTKAMATAQKKELGLKHFVTHESRRERERERWQPQRCSLRRTSEATG